MRMLVFLAYCAYTVWLGECIPGTGTYANAYANQLKDRCVSLFLGRRLWPSKSASELWGMATPADAGERPWIPLS
jgi:hypothetical protein